MSTRRIIDSFQRWRAEGRQLALVTVVETEGSTYSKTGHRIVIADHGDYQGLVSGGCLEGDLAEHAAAVIAHGRAKLVSYDLRDEADAIWGLGIGCNGLIRVLVQRLGPENAYQPFATIADWHLDGTAGSCVLVLDEAARTEPGATLLLGPGGQRACGLEAETAAAIAAAVQASPSPATRRLSVELAGTTIGLLQTPVVPIPRLLILGAGPDAVPLARLAVELGWRVSLADHRAAYLGNPAFAIADETIDTTPAALASRTDLAAFDAAVVMSHHLDTDRAYLAVLAAQPLRYVGLLGPRARRERLLSELGAEARDLARRLHGPVGLDIGADSPESIALAIAAEIQRALAGRPPLT